jgi:hypothetical protein
MLSNYDEKNIVVTETNIWTFDNVSDVDGNEWKMYFADEYNSKTIKVDYTKSSEQKNKLIDKNKSYVYPNPIRDNISKIRVYNYTGTNIEIKIYDAAGYFVDEINEKIDIIDGIWETEWNVSDINSGVYFINVKVANSIKEESIILKVGVIH